MLGFTFDQPFYRRTANGFETRKVLKFREWALFSVRVSNYEVKRNDFKPHWNYYTTKTIKREETVDYKNLTPEQKVHFDKTFKHFDEAFKSADDMLKSFGKE
jgi:hypothetical protein